MWAFHQRTWKSAFEMGEKRIEGGTFYFGRKTVCHKNTIKYSTFKIQLVNVLMSIWMLTIYNNNNNLKFHPDRNHDARFILNHRPIRFEDQKNEHILNNAVVWFRNMRLTLICICIEYIWSQKIVVCST